MSAGKDNEVEEAALVILDNLGVTLDGLMGRLRLTRNVPVPTFADYIPRLVGAVGLGARRTYSPYWRIVLSEWGDRPIDSVTALEISTLAESVQRSAVVRRNSRGGRVAAEHVIGALRCLYRFAAADGLIGESKNPALRVRKPQRLDNTRCALTPSQLDEVYRVASGTGNDPGLDTLLIRLHVETACRRGGAIGLRVEDLDADNSVIKLREKGGTVRLQPVSPTLMRHLLSHGQCRGGGPAGRPLLRYSNGQPLTARRYDYIWSRIGQHAPWVAAQQVTTHWLRYTTLTWVERNFSYATARAYAGHRRSRQPGVTATYVQATLHEVATALSALTGEPHPLAVGDPSTR